MMKRIESEFWAYNVAVKDTKGDLMLLDNVQFIYELSLAELKLKALGIDFEVANGLREFRILNKLDKQKELIKKKGSLF
jgi:hypothetical protein